MRTTAACLTFFAACLSFPAQTPDAWTLTQTPYFLIYSDATAPSAALNALSWFEQIGDFFEQDGLHLAAAASKAPSPHRPLRVVVFRSEEEYAHYRLRSFANAYYAFESERDYIVMVSPQAAQLGVATHEYAHFAFHSAGLNLPSCLHEGLAEFFSTLRPTPGGFLLGGDLPARSHLLKENRARLWSVETLFARTAESVAGQNRSALELFYSQSWALADMLVSSPHYSTGFHQLIAAFDARQTPKQAFQSVYGVTLESLDKDLIAWISNPHPPRFHPTHPNSSDQPHTSALSPTESKSLLAEVSFVSGHIDEAKARYRELLRLDPANPDFPVALGRIALRQGDRSESLRFWRKALDAHVQDPELCYRYAILAEDAGLDPQEVKAGLERAVLLSPAFDDARFHLALVDSHLGDYRAAVTQLRAMALPKGGRLYGYWIALAGDLLELNEVDQARDAALHAVDAAQSEDERTAARRLSFFASTDLAVQLTTDPDGTPHMATTRVPHGTTNWNPFIEPSDLIKHASASLIEVLCTKGKLSGFLVRNAEEGPITVSVPDPTRVLLRNGPAEFYCGPTRPAAVEVDYAINQHAGKPNNILRGMTFLPAPQNP